MAQYSGIKTDVGSSEDDRRTINSNRLAVFESRVKGTPRSRGNSMVGVCGRKKTEKGEALSLLWGRREMSYCSTYNIVFYFKGLASSMGSLGPAQPPMNHLAVDTMDSRHTTWQSQDMAHHWLRPHITREEGRSQLLQQSFPDILLHFQRTYHAFTML